MQRLPPDLVNKDFILSKSYLYKIKSFDNRLKRLTDVVVSIILLIMTAPILIISMLLIYFEDKGPVLYSQSRTGYMQRPIKIFKLRTMRIDAEDEGVRWASENDLRITNIGHFLRKTRFDELPQLISVMKGEMSLIGPRPERPEIDVDLANQIPCYNIRYNLKPGLSGWAQVNYPYGASIKDSSIKLSYDIFYLLNFFFFRYLNCY